MCEILACFTMFEPACTPRSALLRAPTRDGGHLGVRFLRAAAAFPLPATGAANPQPRPCACKSAAQCDCNAARRCTFSYRCGQPSPAGCGRCAASHHHGVCRPHAQLQYIAPRICNALRSSLALQAPAPTFGATRFVRGRADFRRSLPDFLTSSSSVVKRRCAQ